MFPSDLGVAMNDLKTAMALHQAGKQKQAIAIYKRHLKSSPKDRAALAYLGLACFEIGNLSESRKYLKRNITRCGGDGDVFNLLGMVESQSGNPKAARAAFERAVDLDPQSSRAWNNLGNELRKIGDLETAIRHYEQALNADERNLLARENLADTLTETGARESALENFAELSRLDPKNPRFHERIGTLITDSQPVEAESRLRHAIDLQPNRAEWTLALVRFLARRERHLEALRDVEPVLSEDPDHSAALFARANLFKALGRFKEAETDYRRLLEIAPDNPRPLNDISGMKTFHPGDPDLALMEARLNTPGLNPDARRTLLFGVAKAYQDIGDHDRAFEAWRQGNDLKREELEYDVEVDLAIMKKVRSVFSPRLFGSMEGSGNRSPIPTFILGMPRSGTTLVEQILASHSQVHGGGENPYFPSRIQGLRISGNRNSRYPEWVSDVSGADLSALASDLGDGFIADLVSRSTAAKQITDKNPFNFLYIGLIHLALPNARFIHCSRNAMDTCVSCYQMEFTDDIGFSWDLADLGKYHNGYSDLMRHWESVLPDRILRVRYEDVIDDHEGGTRRLLDFCGLDWEAACLDFHKTDRSVPTASLAQVRSGIYRTSVEKWRRYERHLMPLAEALGKTDGTPS